MQFDPFIFTQGLPQDVCYATFFQRQGNLIAWTETFEIILGGGIFSDEETFDQRIGAEL